MHNESSGVDFPEIAGAVNIPNEGLVRYLIERYYLSEPKPDEEARISSHWKHYSALVQIQVDPDGKLVSLAGEGFGTTK